MQTNTKLILTADEKKLRKLHDKLCETCDGCFRDRCAFTEGYKRAKREQEIKELKTLEIEKQRIRIIYGYNQIEFELYFDGYFVGYEKWTDKGWMYSQDNTTWDFKPKYAHTRKLLVAPLSSKITQPHYNLTTK